MRRRKTSNRAAADTEDGGHAAGRTIEPAESQEPRAQRCLPWQGAWQALGGFFNLLAALASRWPKHGV